MAKTALETLYRISLQDDCPALRDPRQLNAAINGLMAAVVQHGVPDDISQFVDHLRRRNMWPLRHLPPVGDEPAVDLFLDELWAYLLDQRPDWLLVFNSSPQPPRPGAPGDIRNPQHVRDLGFDTT